MESPECQCQVYDLSDINIRHCAEKIRNGEVVVFPTETVYGIGASSFSETAIQQIYQVKKRPSNNPLIMHVLNWKGAKLYTDINEIEDSIVSELTDKFWPGPLTILVKKSKHVPDSVSAKTDWVSLRSPSNIISRKLLEYSMVPIVAPSANISGKITSTYKEHILKYFKNSHINLLLDEDPTSLGIESTIVKIDDNNVTVVRPGIITIGDIRDTLTNSLNDSLSMCQVSQCSIEEQSEHPGSSISHYASDKKTLLFNFIDAQLTEQSGIDGKISESVKESIDYYLSQCACIDFNGKNFHCREKFGAYVDLSEDGNIYEALFNLYNVLHQLDTAPVKNILIFDYWSDKEGLYNTMFDRVIRSCSGKRIMIPIS
tara:strand:- start:7998 stop:9113 length:1116 start_codon:yes stop_codon:yes gene_type:complete